MQRVLSYLVCNFKVIKLLTFINCLFVSFIFVSCSFFDKPKNVWIKTQEGIYIYGHRNSSKAEYSWKGKSLNGLAHGYGTLSVVEDNGDYSDSYTGTAKWGALNEKEWKHYLDGRYLGEMEDNKPQGFGVLRIENKTYFGNFEDGLLNDDNASIFIDSLPLYKGGVKNGLFDGKGVVYQNGHVLYKGELKDGKYDGTGTLYKDGIVYYTGEWDNGIRHGDGNGVIQKGNLTFRGVIIDGEIDDTNASLFKDGVLIYKGGIKHGKYNGIGTCFENGHVIYKGELKDGKYEGNGILYKDDVVYYKGEWKNGVFNGQGVLYAEGNEIHGTWSDGHLDDNSIKKQFKRSYNIITNNEEKNEVETEEDDSKYIDNSIFYDSLSVSFTSMIKGKIEENVEDRFDLWDLIRMLWQTLFTDNSKRMDYAQDAFIDGLSAEDVQTWLNIKIREYNNNTDDSVTLHYAKFKPIKRNEIVDDNVFKLVNDREWLEWNDIGIGWIITLIINLILDIILLLTLHKAGCLFSVIKNLIVFGIVFIVVDIHEPGIEGKISNQIIENYINYIENQNIESQIYYEDKD